MEPKDMTRELSKQSDLSLMMRIRDLDIPRGTYWGNPIITELLRRLNEAEALRKENAELRSIVDYVASFMRVEDVGDDEVCPGVEVSSEHLEEDATANGILGFDECEHPFHQPIIDVLRRSAKARSDRLSEASKSTAKCASLSEEINRIKAEDGRAK